jgi:hypothetical protein
MGSGDRERDPDRLDYDRSLLSCSALGAGR